MMLTEQEAAQFYGKEPTTKNNNMTLTELRQRLDKLPRFTYETPAFVLITGSGDSIDLHAGPAEDPDAEIIFDTIKELEAHLRQHAPL